MSKGDSTAIKEEDSSKEVEKSNDRSEAASAELSISESILTERDTNDFMRNRQGDSAMNSQKMQNEGTLGTLSLISSDSKNPLQRNNGEKVAYLPSMDLVPSYGPIHKVDSRKPDQSNSDAQKRGLQQPEERKSVPTTPEQNKSVELKIEAQKKPDTTADGGVKIELSPEQKEAIGKKVWQNEAGGSVDKLTHWNKGEAFPSLGIGHFIWQPEGKTSIYGDSFKAFVKKMEDQKNPDLPKWLNSGMGSPWQTKDQFDANFNSPKMKELREFLVKTVPQQTDHIISRLEESKTKILDAAAPDKKEQISKNFDKVLKSGPQGVFALVDYVNFKGEGLSMQPTYNNTNWGLRQVLENMKDTGNPVKDFSVSAKQTLQNRVDNAPAEKKAQELQWMPGWAKRVDDYQKPLDVQSKPTPEAEQKPADQKPAPSKPEAQQKPEAQEKPQPENKPSTEIKPEKQKPVPDARPQAANFEMPQSVEAKAHPKRGEGYYQPMKAAMKELLGRNLSENETKALVSGAKGLRKEQGKSVNELKQADMILPKNAEEARKFIDNIGNRNFGRQGLSKDGIAKLQDEISKKFKMNEPSKEVPTPEQNDPAKARSARAIDPAKDQSKPEQKDPTKDKAEPANDPAKNQPQQEQRDSAKDKPAQESTPEQRDPAKDKPAQESTPEQRDPVKDKLEPGKEAAKEAVKEAAKEPGKDLPKDSTKPELDASKPVEDHNHAHGGSCPDCGKGAAAKLQPGDLADNVKILKLADGADKDGVKVVNAAKVLSTTTLKEPANTPKDMPVAVVPGMAPGTMGVLTRIGADGKETRVPFIAGQLRNGRGTRDDIGLNAAAAKELGIDPNAPGARFRVDAVALNQKPKAKDADGIRKEVGDRIKDIASQKDVLEKANEANNGRVITDKAYIPKPDDKVGYRRTERSEAELAKIRENLEKDSDKYREMSDKLKPGSPEAGKVIQETLQEAEKEKADLERQRIQMSRIEAALKKGTPASELPENLLKDLPADLQRDLNLARFNRNAYKQNIDAQTDFAYNPFGLHTQTLQDNAQKAQTYYKAQEARALEKARSYGSLSEDKKVLQDRIIHDAKHPRAQELLRHRFEMKSTAAALMSTNPDLVGNKNAKGALDGKRIALNAGHDPYHGSRSPGFPAYDWSKTPQNPKGMSEYDFNRQNNNILAEMVEYAGGVPIHVNQDELYKTNPAAQNMTGLAAALKDTTADVIISNHMDDFQSISPGTLTLVSSKSHKLGALINNGKGEMGVVPAKALREQARGVQAAVKQENMILNEVLTTAPADRARNLNPYEIGKLQLGTLVGMERYLNPRSNAQLNREKQRDTKAGTWDSFWNKDSNKSRHQYHSFSYPDIYR